ncbi:LysR family transcriptional regulator [Paenibacillus sp. GSMTC-2017]|uniref:LysR family transcriptional regulator n=1 Tax=Paenibacillus sp. GSMTC-2017 TaxID=2794350 RepID=UPI0018D6C4B9|nr:LysR family transcriptional regulator [Paenibacillus sp. GSMTC-2017]MBH5319684.1 LysR family transcriptional regulator [Paenibacillus sp. GSMTC-2017]
MINLELYRIFYFAAQAGSISKAAQQLHITQPSASLAIKQLEESMSTVLFKRTTRGVSLTNEGETLFAYVEQAYELLMSGESKMSDVASLNGGEVRIASYTSVIRNVLLPYVKSFHQQYPTIKINILDHSTAPCLKLLKEGKIDFCVVRLPIHDETLQSTKLLSIQDRFVVGEKYKHLADGPGVSLRELAHYPHILFPPHMPSRKALDHFLASHGLVIQPAFEIGTLQLLTGFAEAGLGVAYVIREFVQREISEGALFEVKVKEEIPPIDLGIVQVKQLPLSVAAEQFIELMLKVGEK